MSNSRFENSSFCKLSVGVKGIVISRKTCKSDDVGFGYGACRRDKLPADLHVLEVQRPASGHDLTPLSTMCSRRPGNIVKSWWRPRPRFRASSVWESAQKHPSATLISPVPGSILSMTRASDEVPLRHGPGIVVGSNAARQPQVVCRPSGLIGMARF